MLRGTPRLHNHPTCVRLYNPTHYEPQPGILHLWRHLCVGPLDGALGLPQPLWLSFPLLHTFASQASASRSQDTSCPSSSVVHHSCSRWALWCPQTSCLRLDDSRPWKVYSLMGSTCCPSSLLTNLGSGEALLPFFLDTFLINHGNRIDHVCLSGPWTVHEIW